jgi:hypothetical protein
MDAIEDYARRWIKREVDQDPELDHMWILKNSKDLLDNLQSRSFSQVSSIKTFDLSTLYTTLPHDKLKIRLKETIHKAFSHRNYGSKVVVLGYNSTYLSNKIQKGKTCYSEEQVISMLESLIDNIFVSFGGIRFQQVVGIPMGTNCAPLLADLFLYSYFYTSGAPEFISAFCVVVVVQSAVFCVSSVVFSPFVHLAIVLSVLQF